MSDFPDSVSAAQLDEQSRRNAVSTVVSMMLGEEHPHLNDEDVDELLDLALPAILKRFPPVM